MGLPAVVVMKNPNERLAFSVSVRRGEQRWAGHASAIAILTKAATPTLVDCRKVSRRGKWQFFRASFYHGAKIRNSAVLPLAGNLLGSAFPKPCYAACAAYPRRAHAARKEVTTMRKKYNTPHRSRVVKTRLSEDEYADFTARLAPYGISQSEFLRQAIRRTAIRPVIHVSAVNDELLSAVGKLTAEYGRIGGNLNQIARYLNEYGAPYHALSGEVRAAIADLAALKYEVLKKVGDAVGNTQTYQL